MTARALKGTAGMADPVVAEAARRAAEEAARKAAAEAARAAAAEAARLPKAAVDHQSKAAARSADAEARSGMRLEEPAPPPPPAPVAGVPRGPAVPHRYVDGYSDDVKLMQQRMKDAGIDPGPIDGLKGPLTRAAMAAYEQRFGKSAAEGLQVDPAHEEILGTERVETGGGVEASALDRVSGTVQEWIAEAKRILVASGIPAHKINEAAIATTIQHESSGNPAAVNNWDSNARKGTPSMGLMQTIRPTFEAHKLPGYDQILNPVHNIIAGVRYALDRYGSLENVPGIRSMAAGGRYRGY